MTYGDKFEVNDKEVSSQYGIEADRPLIFIKDYSDGTFMYASMSGQHTRDSKALEYCTPMNTPTPHSQEDLIAFVSDPENVKKAVEGSMEKRQKVLDTPHSESLRDIVGLAMFGPKYYDYVLTPPTTPTAKYPSQRAIDDLNAVLSKIEDHSLQEQIDLLKTVKASFDNHAKSIGLWGMEGLALDTLARSGNLSDEQKAERDAMVTERRALAVLHGVIDAEIATLEAERKKL